MTPEYARTPDPVLGSDALTFLAAVTLAAPAVALPVLLARRGRLPGPRRVALAAGTAYGMGCTLLWATVLLLAAPRLLPGGAALGFVVAATVVVGLQAAIPWYCYARWRLRLPLVGLFGLTTLVCYLCLQVGGESDGYLLYALLGSYALPGLCLLVGLELGGRELGKRVDAA